MPVGIDPDHRETSGWRERVWSPGLSVIRYPVRNRSGRSD